MKGVKDKPRKTEAGKSSGQEHGCSSPDSQTCQASKEELIRKKAYELYEKRGCWDGNDQKDWFEAEQMIGGD